MTTPPFAQTAAALRVTTERLASELASPGERAPEWSDFEWDIARAVATMHGISALLARRLRWTGPARWQEFLVTQREHGVARDRRVDSLRASIDERLRAERVGAIALKGATLRTLGIYEAGDRPMGDIDLLARPRDFPAVERALAALDFQPFYRTQRHAVYCDQPAVAPRGFGEHIGNPLKIEVHAHIAEALPVRRVDITGRLMPGLLRPGLQGYPDRAALLAHLLLHAAGNMRAHALRLIQLQDIALLLPAFTRADWDRLCSDQPWWALPPLSLTQRCFGSAIPREVIETLEARCAPRLRAAARRLTLPEVSWSNLRIAALPGIEWSGSLVETLRYARSRLLPKKHALDELAIATRVQPQLTTVPWYRLSHGNRIARWLFGHPPRVQTMNSVLAALAPDGARRDS